MLFDILMDTQVVGQAEMTKEGLYYRFTCKCTPPDDAVHRIVVSDGKHTRNLGICVPTGEWFCLVSRVPVKYLPGENLRFTLIPKDAHKEMIPVETDISFSGLDKLESACLQETDGNSEIVIDPNPNLLDSGPSQEFLHKWEQL